MKHDETTTAAERLARRLLNGPEDEALYHEFRFEALAQAQSWHSPSLSASLLTLFDEAAQQHRPLAETAAIVLGMLRAARALRQASETSTRSNAWVNSAMVAAGITAVGMVCAAVINHWGELNGEQSKPSAVPAIVKPDIHIVLPTSGAQTLILPSAAAPQPAASSGAAAVPAAKALAPAKAPTPASSVEAGAPGPGEAAAVASSEPAAP